MNIFIPETISRIIYSNQEKIQSQSGICGEITIIGNNECCSSVKISIDGNTFNVFIGAVESCCDKSIILEMNDYRHIIFEKSENL